MTDKIRRRHIRIETHEITIIRRSGGSSFGYCSRCQSMVKTLSMDETLVLLRGSMEGVLELTKGDEIHFTDMTDDAQPLICGNSLGDRNKY